VAPIHLVKTRCSSRLTRDYLGRYFFLSSSWFQGANLILLLHWPSDNLSFSFSLLLFAISLRPPFTRPLCPDVSLLGGGWSNLFFLFHLPHSSLFFLPRPRPVSVEPDRSCVSTCRNLSNAFLPLSRETMAAVGFFFPIRPPGLAQRVLGTASIESIIPFAVLLSEQLDYLLSTPCFVLGPDIYLFFL